VESFAQAVTVSEAVASARGSEADRHSHLDVRGDRIEATLMDREFAAVTTREIELARVITAIDITSIRPFASEPHPFRHDSRP